VRPKLFSFAVTYGCGIVYFRSYGCRLPSLQGIIHHPSNIFREGILQPFCWVTITILSWETPLFHHCFFIFAKPSSPQKIRSLPDLGGFVVCSRIPVSRWLLAHGKLGVYPTFKYKWLVSFYIAIIPYWVGCTCKHCGVDIAFSNFFHVTQSQFCTDPERISWLFGSSKK